MAVTTVDTLLVQIKTDLSDLRRDLKRVERTTQQSTQKVKRSLKDMEGGFKGLGDTIKRLGPLIATGFAAMAVRSFLRTGAEIETLRIRMNTLFGSVEEGTKAFEGLTQFAARVPFSLQEIQQGAGSLAAVADNAEELNELLVITGNIAANFGMSFQDAATNLQRSMSAGIGAADMFRDRGVAAFAGFEAGASYSAAQTARILQENFGTGGKSDGAMDQLAGTFTGAMSMLNDAIFAFQKQVAESGLLEAFTELVNILTDTTKQGDSLAQTIGRALAGAIRVLSRVIIFAKENMVTLTSALIAFISVKAIAGVIAMGAAFAQMARAILAARASMQLLNTLAKRTPVGIIAAILAVTAAELGAVDAVLDRVNQEISNTSDVSERADAAADSLANSIAATEEQMSNLVTVIPDLADGLSDGASATDKIGNAFDSLRDRTNAARLALSGYTESQIAALQAAGQMPFVLRGPGGTAVPVTTGHPEFRGEEPPTEGQMSQPQLEAIFAEADAYDAANKALEEHNNKLSEARSLVDAALTPQQVYNERVDALNYALAQGTITVQEYNSAVAALDQAVKDADTTHTDAISTVQGFIPEADKLAQSIAQVEAAMAANVVTTADGNRALDAMREKVRELDPMYKSFKDGMMQMGDAIADSLADGLVEGKLALDDFKTIFKTFVKQLIAEAIRMYVIRKILGSVFGFPAAGGGNVTSSGTAAGGGAVRGFAGGGRAPMLVGERGPELFVPASAGSIKNNMDTKNILGNSQRPVVVQQTINVETGVSQTVRAEMMSLLPAIKQDTMQAVQEARLRGGSFAQAFGG